jgi:ASC-1-like (ASCH) protein
MNTIEPIVKHDLKTWPEYFEKVLSGEKRFEIRKNDRHFKEGDTLIFMNGTRLTGTLAERFIKKLVIFSVAAVQWG